jgi:putative membrane protein
MPRYRMTILIFMGCLLTLQSNLSQAQDPSGGAVAVSADDRNFLLDASQSGRHEVQMAMLGIEHSSNNDLKVYAQRILDDHVLSNAQVEALAGLKGVVLPGPTKTDPSAVKLSRLSGIEFDTEFVRELIENHIKDLATFEREDQSKSADPDIKAFAHGELPKLQAHLDQAKALRP